MIRQGLREAHAHIAAHGRAMTMERFEACASVEEFLQRLAAGGARMVGNPAGEWLLGGGVRVEGWREPRWPTLREMDEAAGERPVCVWSFDHHAVIVNSAGMRAAGVAPGTADPAHGRIVRDRAGQPTGVMLESAAKQVWSRVPEPGREQRREQVKAALADLAGHRFVEVHDLLSPPWLGSLLGELERAGQLSMRVRLYPALADLDTAREGRTQWESERVALAGAKVFADGTLNSRTAWMLQPFADPLPGLPRGEAMCSREQLGAAMGRVWADGLGLAVHAIGDAAVRAVLDAFEDTAAPADGRAVAPGLRIEHAEVIDEADVPRFARLGVVASVQPCHLLTDIEVLRRQLPGRLSRVLPLRELIDSGCAPGELLWFGSDTPIVRPHPGDSIRAALHRRREGMSAPEALAPEQAISETEAWRAFGVGA